LVSIPTYYALVKASPSSCLLVKGLQAIRKKKPQGSALFINAFKGLKASTEASTNPLIKEGSPRKLF